MALKLLLAALAALALVAAAAPSASAASAGFCTHGVCAGAWATVAGNTVSAGACINIVACSGHNSPPLPATLPVGPGPCNVLLPPVPGATVVVVCAP